MKFSELPHDLQKTATECLSQLVVNGAEPTKELALSVRDAFVSMHKEADSNAPFIYSGNLDLISLINWLEDELNNLRSVKGAITRSKNTLNSLIEDASAVIQCQPLINNLRHHQDSSLFSDSNQYSKDLDTILTELDSSLILYKNYRGVGLSVKQRPSAEGLMCSAHQTSNYI